MASSSNVYELCSRPLVILANEDASIYFKKVKITSGNCHLLFSVYEILGTPKKTQGE